MPRLRESKIEIQGQDKTGQGKTGQGKNVIPQNQGENVISHSGQDRTGEGDNVISQSGQGRTGTLCLRDTMSHGKNVTSQIRDKGGPKNR